MASRRIAVGPETAPNWVRDAVVAGGAELCAVDSADGLVWSSAYSVGDLDKTINDNPHLQWVQLPFAGSEAFIHLVDNTRLWTCGKGVYAEPVAEHVLALLLAGFRNIGEYARAKEWAAPVGRNLFGANITILGAGGIATSLVGLLQPFQCSITVVRNGERHFDGADIVVASDRLIDALVGADAVVVALALTPATVGILGRHEFENMEPHAWVVNVGRGRHIVTNELVDALRAGTIGGAALDVTDPEPLPAEHPLWSLSNCIITPHVGNTPEMAIPLLSERITGNVRRFIAGETLVGLIDPDLGY